MMGNYSKLFGALLGGGAGLAAALGVNVEWFTPELKQALTVILGILGTVFFPANKPAD